MKKLTEKELLKAMENLIRLNRHNRDRMKDNMSSIQTIFDYVCELVIKSNDKKAIVIAKDILSEIKSLLFSNWIEEEIERKRLFDKACKKLIKVV